MKLIFVVDLLDEHLALNAVARVGHFFDLIEVGTNLFHLCGIGIVAKIKEHCPDKPVYIDSKIIDGPEQAATLMCNSGAQMFSMLALASDQAVSAVLRIADAHGVDVMFDMQRVQDYRARSARLKSLGARYLCVHKNADCGDSLISSFRECLDIQGLGGIQMAIAGGVDVPTLERIKPILTPEYVIVGKAVINAPNMEIAAQRFREMADR
ncbi:MAG: orotidine 5'-phosphate decarboxylase [Formivibrio sp.]|nr:orotidine 5'-phosphate decarboxylase [Formivibrio sp.]